MTEHRVQCKAEDHVPKDETGLPITYHELAHRFAHLEREQVEDQRAIQAWLDYFEPYFKEKNAVTVPWRVFRDWKEEHAHVIARITKEPHNV